MTLVARIDFRWKDERLALTRKNAQACKGQEVLVKTKDIWFPYWLVQNGAETIFYPDAFEKYPSILGASGRVQWRVAFTFLLSCDLNVHLFPFDEQACKFLLQSPHFGFGELNYTSLNKSRAVVMLDAGTDHPLWDITGQYVETTRRVPGIVFWITYRRKYLYYIYTLAIPMRRFSRFTDSGFFNHFFSLLIPVAVFIQTAVTFVLPADYGEKMSTAAAGLLSYFFIFLLFVDTTPMTSTEIPILLLFFAFQIILTVVVVIVTSIIGRLVRLEKQEEEQEEERQAAARKAKHLSFNDPYQQRPRTSAPRIFSSLFNRRTTSAAETMADETLDGAAQALHKRCMHSESVNDLCLVVYCGIVVVSMFVLFLYVAIKETNWKLPVETTPVLEFKAALDG